MSNKELKRHYIIKQCVEGTLTSSQAAQYLCLSTRLIKQLKKEFKEKGAVAVIHGNARRPSPKRLDQEKREVILELRKDECLSQSNFTHFTEILNERHNLKVSYSTVYLLLTKECLLGYNEVLRQTLTHYGIPQSLYPDRYSVFFVTPEKNPPFKNNWKGLMKS